MALRLKDKLDVREKCSRLGLSVLLCLLLSKRESRSSIGVYTGGSVVTGRPSHGKTHDASAAGFRYREEGRWIDD